MSSSSISCDKPLTTGIDKIYVQRSYLSCTNVYDTRVGVDTVIAEFVLLHFSNGLPNLYNHSWDN